MLYWKKDNICLFHAICLEIIDRWVYANISLIYVLRPAKQIQVPLVDRDLVREFSPRLLRDKQVYGAHVWILISRRKLTSRSVDWARGTWESRAPSPSCKPWGITWSAWRGSRENCGDSTSEEMRAMHTRVNKHNSINWNVIKFDALKHAVEVSKQLAKLKIVIRRDSL